MEEYISGTIVSFDGVADSHCVPLFYTSNVFPTPLLDIVSRQGDLAYWTQKKVPAKLKDVGFRTIKAFGAKSRFFHCEFFRLDADKPGLGKKGDYVALEVNMRPAGGYTPDMINYANSVDCYQIWADMVCYDEVRNLDLNGPKYFCVYASRRDCHTYRHSHEAILARYGTRMKMCDVLPPALRLDMGDPHVYRQSAHRSRTGRLHPFRAGARLTPDPNDTAKPPARCMYCTAPGLYPSFLPSGPFKNSAGPACSTAHRVRRIQQGTPFPPRE